MRGESQGAEYARSMQAGLPYRLNPYTLGTMNGRPDTLNGTLIDGIAPSSTSSAFLDQVTRLLPILMLMTVALPGLCLHPSMSATVSYWLHQSWMFGTTW